MLMTPCNVQLFGYSTTSAFVMRDKVNQILQRINAGHDSITTIVNSDVKCAEHALKSERYLRVCTDDAVGGKQVAMTLLGELDEAVELLVLSAVFLPVKSPV